MPNLKFHFRASKSDTLGVGHRNVCVRKPSRQEEPRPFQLCSLYILNCVLHILGIIVVTIIMIMMLQLTSSHTSTASFIPQTRTWLPHPFSPMEFFSGPVRERYPQEFIHCADNLGKASSFRWLMEKKNHKITILKS